MPETRLRIVKSKKNEAKPKLKQVLGSAIERAQKFILKQQFPEGYWWYTLEANETIDAEAVMLMHLLGNVDLNLETALCKSILSQQRPDGSWGLYHRAPGDLSTTVECYFALKLAGHSPNSNALSRARKYILRHGGITQSRVFTKIHLALFGLVPWSACPAMPAFFMLLPAWFPINIYEFSSWARASMTPLFIVLNRKPVKDIHFDLEELFVEVPKKRDYSFKTEKGLFSWENFFIQVDKVLKVFDPFARYNPLNLMAIQACKKYIEDHVSKTEDIYPALSYAAIAFSILGYGNDHPVIKKSLSSLQRFKQVSDKNLDMIPRSLDYHSYDELSENDIVYQQCCISPIWDTAWAGISLIDSGLAREHPQILESCRYLLEKQVKETRGDWAIKRPHAQAGGWAFEFENEYYPDVDDTLAVLTLLFKSNLPNRDMIESFDLGLAWIKEMQCKNGGWAAFDVDNELDLVNHIPFSDHGACLDPATPDITGRVLEFFGLVGEDMDSPAVKKALDFIFARQENNGSWEGRWGVNYLYGTWCVLTGLHSLGYDLKDPRVKQAVRWLKSIQNEDGGWGESPEGYHKGNYVPWHRSVPSQSSWAIMALIAVGEAESPEVKAGIHYLIEEQNTSGTWHEEEHTGTGFPGYFYIRYHGYRQYFPLMALGKYQQAKKVISNFM